ncbi:sensor histidine kinase [Paenibacillus silvisoli]|uniref:sensor histidine kinase n=1 Tax=Paenibacillus silvisoli TaxID=3110539 RepID=UPI002805F18E|nr:ATP-binding protein [Paenibacillus silvisoli]
MFKRTQAALTRQFSVTIGIILALTVLFALWMVQHMITASQNNQLLSISKQYASELNDVMSSPKWKTLLNAFANREKLSASFAPSGLQLNQMAWLIGPKGDILLQSSGKDNVLSMDFPLTSLLPSLLDAPDNTFDNVHAGDRTFRVGGILFNAGASETYRIIVAQEVTNDVALLARLRWAFIGFAAAMLVLGAGAGYLLAGRAMIPIVQAYRRQEQFTADASHELRTPLSILRSSMEVLNEQREALPSFHRRVLAKSGKEIHHLIRLVDNLLTLARSDNGRIELMKTTFSLSHTIRQVVEQLEPLAAGKQIRIACKGLDSGDVCVHGDEVRIRQLAFILVENAIQYNREGGTVTIGVEAGLSELTMTVADTGIGISKAHLSGIFERFYRLDQARTRRSEGMGLGLAIAKQIVLAHQGKLRVESQEGAGTTFYVRLPNLSESFQNVPLQ